MPPIPEYTGAVIFTLLQFAIFALVVIATPTPQFSYRVVCDPGSCWKNVGCITVWGRKRKCSGVSTTWTGTQAFFCGRARNNMNGAAAFAIFSIVVTLVLFILGVVLMMQKAIPKIVILLLSILAVGTTMISWACVAGVYSEKLCHYAGVDGKQSYKQIGFDYGVGFYLMVIAFCLQCLNTIWMLALMFMK